MISAFKNSALRKEHLGRNQKRVSSEASANRYFGNADDLGLVLVELGEDSFSRRLGPGQVIQQLSTHHAPMGFAIHLDVEKNGLVTVVEPLSLNDACHNRLPEWFEGILA